MAHHLESLVDIIKKYHSYYFMTILILNYVILLANLKKLVCTKKSSFIPQVIGIPPHIKQFEKFNEIRKLKIEDHNRIK